MLSGHLLPKRLGSWRRRCRRWNFNSSISIWMELTYVYYLYGLRLALMIANQLNNDVENALNNYTEYLLNTISSPAACFPLSSSPSSCFTSRATSPPSFTLAFQPGERDDFLTTLRHSPFTSNSHLEFSSPLSNIQAQSEGNGGLISSLSARYLWLPTAVSTLFNRLRTLFFRASPLDIALITAGYLLMHSTFFRLLLSARALGSHFWLTAAILTSSTLGFVLALPLAMLIGIPVDPVLLTEALPFLVCTVGFDKPLRFGRAVFQHEFLFAPLMPSSKHYTPPSSFSPSSSSRRQQQQMLPAATLLLEALDRCGNALLRDSALEIAVLTVGANSKVGGLRECCALAALILGVDCLMSATFLVAVMGVMIEVSSAFHSMNFHFICPLNALCYSSEHSLDFCSSSELHSYFRFLCESSVEVRGMLCIEAVRPCCFFIPVAFVPYVADAAAHFCGECDDADDHSGECMTKSNPP